MNIQSDRSNWQDYEVAARLHFENRMGFSLNNQDVLIQGKKKSFDLVNTVHKVVGDVKHYRNTKSGNIPSAKRSTLNEYVWLLQKLSDDWSKMIVIGEDLQMATKYVHDFTSWLGDVKIFYYERPEKVIVLRG